MIVQSLGQIQKNIGIISWANIIKVIDKGKKKQIATIIPYKRKNKILHLWWILKNKISSDKLNTDFEVAKKKQWNYILKKSYEKINWCKCNCKIFNWRWWRNFWKSKRYIFTNRNWINRSRNSTLSPFGNIFCVNKVLWYR